MLRNKKTLLLQYVFSYLAILIIPLLILGFFVTQRTFSIQENSNRNLNQSRLYTLRESVQKQMDNIVRFYILASENPLLSMIQSDFTPTESLDAVKVLDSYRMANSYLSEIISVPENGDKVYSSSGVFLKKDYLPPSYVSGLNGERLLRVIPAYKGNKIALILPFPIHDTSLGSIVFLLEKSRIEGHMERLISSSETSSLIYDSEGNILSSFNLPRSGDIIDLYNILYPRDSHGSRTIQLGNRTYLATWIFSEEFNWTYATLTPETMIMKSVRSIAKTVTWSVFIIMVLEFVLISLLLKLQYYPLRKLKALTEHQLGMNLDSANELKAMMDAVDIIREEKKLSVSARREFLLFNTLKGRIPTREEFNLKGREIGIVFNHKVFVVAILHVSAMDSRQRTEIQNWLAAVKEDHFDLYIRDIMDESKLILLFSTSDFPDLQKRLLIIKEELFTEFQLVGSLGIGRPCVDLKAISRSYLEASTAVEYRLVKGSGNTIYFENIIGSKAEISWYSRDDIKALYYAIKRGDQESITNIMQKLIDYFSKSTVQIFVAKCLAYDILYTVLNTIEEMGYSGTLPFYPDGVILDKFESIRELSDMLLDLCSETCKLLKEKETNAFPELKEQLLAYVNENYMKPDFYAQSLADEFSLSASYLSQYFKSAVGENLKDYVYRLKIQKTKELLEATDLNIKDIVPMVGYQNVSSFCRKFKMFTGKSPKEYRDDMKRYKRNHSEVHDADRSSLP